MAIGKRTLQLLCGAPVIEIIGAQRGFQRVPIHARQGTHIKNFRFHIYM